MVTSMSLAFLDVTPGCVSGVWEQGRSSSSSWARSQGQPCPCSSCTTIWGLSKLLCPGFPVSTDGSSVGRGGRSSLFPAEPRARAFTSTTDPSTPRIKESSPLSVLFPLSIPFLF